MCTQVLLVESNNIGKRHNLFFLYILTFGVDFNLWLSQWDYNSFSYACGKCINRNFLVNKVPLCIWLLCFIYYFLVFFVFLCYFLVFLDHFGLSLKGYKLVKQILIYNADFFNISLLIISALYKFIYQISIKIFYESVNLIINGCFAIQLIYKQASLIFRDL